MVFFFLSGVRGRFPSHHLKIITKKVSHVLSHPALLHKHGCTKKRHIRPKHGSWSPSTPDRSRPGPPTDFNKPHPRWRVLVGLANRRMTYRRRRTRRKKDCAGYSTVRRGCMDCTVQYSTHRGTMDVNSPRSLHV